MTIVGLLKNLKAEEITVEGALILMELSAKQDTGMTVPQLSKSLGIPEKVISNREKNLPVMIAKNLVVSMHRKRYSSWHSYRLTQPGVEFVRRLMTVDNTAKSTTKQKATSE
jgi:hypothetical protein